MDTLINYLFDEGPAVLENSINRFIEKPRSPLITNNLVKWWSSRKAVMAAKNQELAELIDYHFKATSKANEPAASLYIRSIHTPNKNERPDIYYLKCMTAAQLLQQGILPSGKYGNQEELDNLMHKSTIEILAAIFFKHTKLGIVNAHYYLAQLYISNNLTDAIHQAQLLGESKASIAATLFKYAADRGFVKAQYNLASLYLNDMVDWDTQKVLFPEEFNKFVIGAKLLKSAADKNFAMAQYSLAELYYYDPVPQELYQAQFPGLSKIDIVTNLYKLAADQGDPKAQTKLAVLYLDNKVPANIHQMQYPGMSNISIAASLLKSAASGGEVTAQTRLASLYRNESIPMSTHKEIFPLHQSMVKVFHLLTATYKINDFPFHPTDAIVSLERLFAFGNQENYLNQLKQKGIIETILVRNLPHLNQATLALQQSLITNIRNAQPKDLYIWVIESICLSEKRKIEILEILSNHYDVKQITKECWTPIQLEIARLTLKHAQQLEHEAYSEYIETEEANALFSSSMEKVDSIRKLPGIFMQAHEMYLQLYKAAIDASESYNQDGFFNAQQASSDFLNEMRHDISKIKKHWRLYQYSLSHEEKQAYEKIQSFIQMVESCASGNMPKSNELIISDTMQPTKEISSKKRKLTHKDTDVHAVTGSPNKRLKLALEHENIDVPDSTR